MKNNTNGKEHYVNEDIRTLGYPSSKQFRVITADGEQLGLLTYNAAMQAANDRNLDLVLISPQADPPVCKIIDYGKFRFERDKREKEAKKKQQVADIKEIQLSLNIDTNDLNTKVNHARKFLDGGDKVRVVARFRGRQMSHTEVGADLLAKFAESCADYGTIDKAPLLEGRSMTMFLAPLKASEKAARAKAAAAAAAENAAAEPETETAKDETEE